MIKLLINQDSQIVDYGDNVHEDDTYYYGSTFYGPLAKNLFMDWSGVVEVESLPDNFNVTDWMWDIASQSIVRREFPVDTSAQAAAIAKTVSDFDNVVRDAIGNRLNIYLECEKAAREYVAAGYTGDVSQLVSAYAMCNPTKQVQTNQWAADAIIARADFLRSKEQALHIQRLASQSEMRHAVYKSHLEAAVNTWNAYVTQMRADLGLPINPQYAMTQIDAI